MFLAYDIKNGKQYAKLVKSIRKGAKVEKDYIYLGLVLNIEDIHCKEYIEALVEYRTSSSIKGMVKLFELEQKNYLEQCEYFYQY